MFSKLQQRWGLHSFWQVFLVMVVFSLAGMSILPTRQWVFHLLHFDGQTPVWLKTIVWLLVVFPAYQVFLLVYGTLLGQFRFFWEKEKKMARWILRRLGLRADDPQPASP